MPKLDHIHGSQEEMKKSERILSLRREKKTVHKGESLQRWSSKEVEAHWNDYLRERSIPCSARPILSRAVFL